MKDDNDNDYGEPDFDIHNKPASALQMLIDGIEDQELKNAITVLSQKLGDPIHDRSCVMWPINGAHSDGAAIYINISIW